MMGPIWSASLPTIGSHWFSTPTASGGPSGGRDRFWLVRAKSFVAAFARMRVVRRRPAFLRMRLPVILLSAFLDGRENPRYEGLADLPVATKYRQIGLTDPTGVCS